MATQHTFQNSPGVKPSMAFTSWENLCIPAEGRTVMALRPMGDMGTATQTHHPPCPIPASPGVTHVLLPPTPWH